MKRTIFAVSIVLVVFVAVFAMFALRPVPKVKASFGGCSDRTLRGWYGLTAQGYFGNPADESPYFFPGNFSMLVYFNGWGGTNSFQGSNIKVFYLTPTGTVNPTVANFTTGGTYTVDSNCTVTFTTPYFASINATITGYGTVLLYGETFGNLSSDNNNVTGTFDLKALYTAP